MIPSPPLPLEMEQRLRSELNRTEKLIWSGQPIAKRSIESNLPIAVLGVPFTTVWVFWVIMAFSVTRDGFPSELSVSSFFLWVFGLPSGLFGVWMLSSPYRVWRKAQKTVYALTDERALILTPTWRGGVSVRSITPEKLSPRKRTRNSDGSGSLFFSRVTVTLPSAGPSGTYVVPVGFEHIADVRDVEALIEKTYRVSAGGVPPPPPPPKLTAPLVTAPLAELRESAPLYVPPGGPVLRPHAGPAYRAPRSGDGDRDNSGSSHV